MSQPGPPPAAGTGERWSVNMPAVIGVVFVFLVAVIVWVIATSGGDGGGAAAPTSSPTTGPPVALVTTTDASVATTPVATVPSAGATTIVSTTPATTVAESSGDAPPTTAAAPTVPPTTVPPTTVATTTTVAPAATAAPPDDGGAGGAGGDLGIDGAPMRKPPCDDDYITVIASVVGTQAAAASVESVLDGYPGSNYLRTDQTCPSLNPSLDGEPIYVVYFGPFSDDGAACNARSDGTSGSYVRRLSTSLGPDHSVSCA